VEPSAAMSKVVSGWLALNASANCGTSLAPSVSDPLMTNRSASAAEPINISPRVRNRVGIFIASRTSCRFIASELKLHAKIGLKDAVLMQRVQTECVPYSPGAQRVVGLFPITICQVEKDSVADRITRLDDEALHVNPAIEDVGVNQVRVEGKL